MCQKHSIIRKVISFSQLKWYDHVLTTSEEDRSSKQTLNWTPLGNRGGRLSGAEEKKSISVILQKISYQITTKYIK